MCGGTFALRQDQDDDLELGMDLDEADEATEARLQRQHRMEKQQAAQHGTPNTVTNHTGAEA